MSAFLIDESRDRATALPPSGWLHEARAGADFGGVTSDLTWPHKPEICGLDYLVCNAVGAGQLLYSQVGRAAPLGSRTDMGMVAHRSQGFGSGYVLVHPHVGIRSQFESPTTTSPDFGKLAAVDLAVGLVMLCAIAASGTETAIDLRLSDPAENESSALFRFQRCLEAWRGRLFTGTRDRLNRQLLYLFEDEEDLAEGGVPDMRSFEALLNYLAVRPWIKAPSLTLTQSGVFVAHWRPVAQAKARLSVDFIDEKRVRWSAADARQGDTPSITGGICPVSELDDHLGKYQSWMSLFER